jgi:Protein of unknown function (DUF3089)
MQRFIKGAMIASAILLSGHAAQALTVASEPTSVAAPSDYSVAANWLCRPGRLDSCTQTDLSSTIVQADGSTTVEAFRGAEDAKVDCFYVYPTVSFQTTPNSDMTVTAAERNVAIAQLARFGAKCRLYAPMYRQVTLTALRTAMMGKPNPGDPDLAYADVKAAWSHYLAHDNQGRGVVLIGHSQGTRWLTQLIAQEIDGKPVQAQVISALLLGGQVLVAEHKDVGGSFKAMPLCRAADQTGCIVAYNSFRAEIPPPADSRFARSPVAGQQVACVNPAALAGGDAVLKAYLPTGTGVNIATTKGPDWTGSGTPVTTTFVSLPGLIHGQCVQADGASYFQISLTPTPGARRTSTINGDIMVGPNVLKSWGLHLIDVNVAEGDLVDLVGRQSAAWLSKH